MKMNLTKVLLALMLSVPSILNAQTTGTNPADTFYYKPNLGQNSPNPFSSCTEIGFTLPINVKSAYIKVYSKNGKEVKSIDVMPEAKQMIVLNPDPPYKKEGVINRGSISVCMDKLRAGTYNYSLLIDGNVVYTKQMEITK